jgi:hypothetical protein
MKLTITFDDEKDSSSPQFSARTTASEEITQDAIICQGAEGAVAALANDPNARLRLLGMALNDADPDEPVRYTWAGKHRVLAEPGCQPSIGIPARISGIAAGAVTPAPPSSEGFVDVVVGAFTEDHVGADGKVGVRLGQLIYLPPPIE